MYARLVLSDKSTGTEHWAPSLCITGITCLEADKQGKVGTLCLAGGFWPGDRSGWNDAGS